MLTSIAEKVAGLTGTKLREVEPGAMIGEGERAPVLNHRGEYQGALQIRVWKPEQAKVIWEGWKKAFI